MAKGNIDPAFQAAPYLGDSSHDPVEFTRRQSMIKYQRGKQKQAEIERNTAKGLDKLMIDLDGWNDKEGFKEVMSRQQKAKDMYMELATKGVNFVNPTTEGEVMAYKALTDYQAKTKEIADLRNSQKAKIDIANKLIQADALKAPEDQVIDHEATRKNTEAALTDNTIAGRDEKLNNLVVLKPQIGDSYKYVEEHKNALPKLDQIQVSYVDEETGKQGTRMVVQWTPEKKRETEKKLRELYRAAPQKIKNAVELYKEQNPEFKLASGEDAFVAQHMTEYAEKFIDKKSGTGGGFNISLFGGQKAKVTPAIKNDNPVPLGERTYDEHYDFNIKTPFIGISMSALGADVYQGDKWEPASKEGGLVNAQLNFYDPKTDSFIFTSTANSMDAGVFKSQIFSVPRSRLGKEVDELPIIKDDGKPGKLKDIYGQYTGAKKLPLPANFWSQGIYLPKNKK